MTTVDRIKEDLNYVAKAVRHQDRPSGMPAIYFLWAVIVPIGFALPDFAPQYAGPFWFFAGIGGGFLSMWLGARASRRAGINDSELGKRYGLHWLIAGVAFVLCALPMIIGRDEIGGSVTNYMLVSGIVYALAGVHLERPLLWCGLLMLAAYAAMVIVAPPYVWTITGVVIAISLTWAGFTTLSKRRSTPQ